MRLDPNSETSYIFEVDLLIPENIHDKTSDYPLCPEKLDITEEMISPKSWFVESYITTLVLFHSILNLYQLCDFSFQFFFFHLLRVQQMV